MIQSEQPSKVQAHKGMGKADINEKEGKKKMQQNLWLLDREVATDQTMEIHHWNKTDTYQQVQSFK